MTVRQLVRVRTTIRCTGLAGSGGGNMYQPKTVLGRYVEVGDISDLREAGALTVDSRHDITLIIHHRIRG